MAHHRNGYDDRNYGEGSGGKNHYREEKFHRPHDALDYRESNRGWQSPRRYRSPPSRDRQPNSWDSHPRNAQIHRAYQNERSPGPINRRGSADDYAKKDILPPGTSDRYHDRDEPHSYKAEQRRSSPTNHHSPDYGDPPSNEIMLDQLSLDMSEEDILHGLKHDYGLANIDSVRLIRSRDTKRSRGLAFVTLPSIGQAENFMRQYYPTIILYPRQQDQKDRQSCTVRLRFSRGREGPTDTQKTTWICSNCSYDNYSTRKRCVKCEQLPQASFEDNLMDPNSIRNHGDSDVAQNGPPSQYLILRGLESSVSEPVLAKGVAKLFKPTASASSAVPDQKKKNNAKVQSTTDDANLGAKESSLRRVMLVKDRLNNESWRYGFAEFAAIEDAQAALTRYHSLDNFTISSKTVLVDFVHTGVFVPILNNYAANAPFSLQQYHSNGTQFMYWDQNAWVSELVINAAPVEASSNGDAASAAKQNDAVNTRSGEHLTDGKLEEERHRKRKADNKEVTKQKKTAPAHLQFWSDRHAELHGGTTEKLDKSKTISNVSHEDTNSAQASTYSSQHDPSALTEYSQQESFGNPKKMCCYLCARQFKTTAEVNKHERLSELHLNNLKLPELVEKARAKLRKAGIVGGSIEMGTTTDNNDDYRDRAKERRETFGTSAKVKGHKTRITLPMKDNREAEKKVNKTIGEESDQDDEPIPSKGAALLSKMGWSKGEGLGAHGSSKGILAPIETDMYVSGVGLGAKGGKVGDAVTEAGKQTRSDFGEWTAQGKDRARERYEKMV